jgi:hypothetical protein
MTISTNKKMGKSSYVCKIMQFKNDFAMIWCIKQYHPNQDTFLHPLHIKITDTLEFHEAGLLMVINCHGHGGEKSTALNSQDGYPRKLIIACPDEKTHESQIECLTKVKEVRKKLNSHSAMSSFIFSSFLTTSLFPSSSFKQEMEHLENNKFRYIYIIDDDLDLTPPNDQLELMDAYMLDHQLLNFMQQVLEGADQLFYQNNTDIANDFPLQDRPTCSVPLLA